MPTPASMLIKLASDSALSTSSVADTELLQRYAVQRDEAAFAELVHRNGPVVLRACRHVLGEAGADDAFQAVFLLLARSAKRLTRPGSLAGWLHAAAVRIAHNARRSESRRRKREAARHVSPSSPEDLSWREVREVLDTEIAALPESYRLPLVLCYIQELTHEEAARRSGCPVGVFRGRLERGRERLRKRLARYGLPVASPVLVLGAASPVSAALVGSTIRSTRAGTMSGAVPSAIANLLYPAGRVRFTLLLASAVASLTAFGMVLGAVCGSSDDQPPAELPRLQTPIAAAEHKPEPTDILGDPLPPGALARLGSARFQHDDMITGIAVCSDGKLVASRGRRPVSFYKLFEGETGRPVPLCDALMKADLRSTRYTIEEYKNTLAAVVNDVKKKESYLLNPITGEIIGQLPPYTGTVFFTHISPDGKTVATFRRENKEGRVRSLVGIWNADSKVQTDHELEGNTFPGSDQPFPFSADSKVLAFHAGSGEILVWDLPGMKLRFQRPAQNKMHSEGIALSPDGKLLAYDDCETHKIRIWDLDTGKELPDLPDQPKEVGRGVMAFSRDGKVLAGLTTWDSIRLWDLTARKKLRDIQANGLGTPAYLVGVRQLAFTSDGKRLYAADGNRVSVWDPATGKPLDDYGGHHSSIASAVWSPDGKHLASTSVLDNYVSIWDVRTGRKLLDLSGHKWIEAVTYSPDGSLLATRSQDGTASLCDTTTGKELHSFAIKDGSVCAIAFTPDGKFLVTDGDKALHVWDVAGRKEARTIPNTGTPIQQIKFLGDGQRILTQDSNHTIRILDFATGRELSQFADIGDLPLHGGISPNAAISPDERFAAYPLKNGQVRLSDLSTGRDVRVLSPSTNTIEKTQAQDLVGLAFSPDGRTLAAAYWPHQPSQTVAYWHGDVRVFEVATGSERFRFTGHADCPLGVAFSPDGTRLCSYGGDRTLLIWDVTGTRLPSAPTPKNMDAAWADLASQDAGRGFAAVRYLATDPTSALRHLNERVRPVVAADPKVVAGLISKLGSKEFKERESASKELAALAPGAIDQILKAAQETNSPEVRVRLEAILPSVNGAALQGEQLRAVRAVEVLERIASPDARKLLAALAKGASDAILTREVMGAVRRLGGEK